MYDFLFRQSVLFLNFFVGNVITPERSSAQVHTFFSSIILLLSIALYLVYFVFESIWRHLCSVKRRNPDFYDVQNELESEYDVENVPDGVYSITEETQESESTEDLEKRKKSSNATEKVKATSKKISDDITENISRHTKRAHFINVYTEIYGLGMIMYVVFYVSDMLSFVPSYMFLVGLTLNSLLGFSALVEMQKKSISSEMAVKRLSTIAAAVCLNASLISMGIGMTKINEDLWTAEYYNNTLLDNVLSFVLPLVAPLGLNLVPEPKLTDVTITRAIPLTGMIAVWYVMSCLAYEDDNIENVKKLFDTGKHWPWIIALTFAKSASTIAIISACLHSMSLDIACMLGLVLFAKEIPLSSQHSYHASVIAALVFCVVALVLRMIRHCKPVVEAMARCID